MVERFGRFNRVLRSGIHFVFWPIDRVKTLEINQRVEVDDLKCRTKDRVELVVKIDVYYTIIEPQKTIYFTDDVPSYVSSLASDGVMKLASATAYDEFATTQTRLIDYVSTNCDKAGIKCTSVMFRYIEFANDALQQYRALLDAGFKPPEIVDLNKK